MTCGWWRHGTGDEVRISEPTMMVLMSVVELEGVGGGGAGGEEAGEAEVAEETLKVE